MDRRAPGLTAGSTPRCEADRPQFLSGLLDGKLTGAPLCAVIENTNVKSHDYANILHLPRPSHADYTGSVRYGGSNDIRGGGHFSGQVDRSAYSGWRYLPPDLGKTRDRHRLSRVENSRHLGYPSLAVSLDADALRLLNQEPFTVIDLQKKREMCARIAQSAGGKRQPWRCY